MLLFVLWFPRAYPVRAADELPFVVNGIRIEGLQRIAEGTLFNSFPLSIGDSLDAARVREALRAVHATGFFDDVGLRREDGGVLLIVVRERPSIRNFEVHGDKTPGWTRSAAIWSTSRSLSTRASGPASGAGLVAFSTDSGTYRLRVTADGDNADVRLDIPDFTRPDRGIGAPFPTSSRGGTLVNAVWLPQGGQSTKLVNTKARLRGAVQVTLTVNGATATPDISLQAGADYTLLVWGDAATPMTSVIVDDNRLPSSSSNAKLRLLNGMSTLGAPLTLSMDFSPLIEGVPVGQASEASNVQSGTDRQFDITNTSTAVLVLTRSGITLQSGSVYTFFMTDNGSTPIGVLRRDRQSSPDFQPGRSRLRPGIPVEPPIATSGPEMTSE